MSSRSRPWGTRPIYEFIKAHNYAYDVKTICRVLDMSRAASASRQWRTFPRCDRTGDSSELLLP